jgi:hypothetical protein
MKYKEGEIDWQVMSKILLEALNQCENFDDVTSLIKYCLDDESRAGLECAKNIADSAHKMRESQKLKVLDRNGKACSKTVEYIVLANTFAKFSCAQDRSYFLKFFQIANDAGDNCLGYRLLAGTPYDARGNLQDETLDPELQTTKALSLKAGELCVSENSVNGIDDMIYLAKNKVDDKDLTKSLIAFKKKIKK